MSEKRHNLVLTRKYGEALDIYVGDEKITVTFLSRYGTKSGSGGRSARICITSNPDTVKVLRSEKGEWDGFKK